MNQLDLPALLAVAGEVLDECVAPFLAGAGAPSAVAKGGTDFATEMDLALERRIVSELEQRTQIPVHGEEFGGPDPSTGVVWLVDPVDGTFNYSVGLPMTAMLLALVVNGDPVIGLTWVPRLDQRFAAHRGGPLLIDGQPVDRSPLAQGDGLYSAAIGYSSSRADSRGIFPGAERAWVQDQIARRDARIRIHGCTGFDMAYVAAGHLSGAISYGSHPWDHAAGVALVRAAGGQATDIHGRPWSVATPSLVTGTPAVHAALLGVLARGDWPDPVTLTYARPSSR